MVVSYYEPPKGLPEGVGVYFFDTAQHARAFYNESQAPYLRTLHKPLNLIELRRNAVVAWLGPPAKPYRKIVLGCLRTR